MKFTVGKYQHKFFQNLLSCFNSQDFCDVSIFCDGTQKFLAHKIVLAASCDYFNSMFRTDFYENQSNSIILKNIKANIVHDLLGFIYSGCINITKDNAQDLLVAADQYGMIELLNTCCSYLKKNMEPSNVVGIYLIAEQLNCRELMKSSFNYMKINFSSVVNSEEFVTMPFNRFIKYLSSPCLMVDSEKEVFHAVMAWLFHDISERETKVEEVMKTIRMSVLSYEFLRKEYEFCSSSTLKNYLKKVISEILDYDYSNSICRSNRLMSECSMSRLSSSSKMYLLDAHRTFPGVNYPSLSLIYYDFNLRELKYIPSLKAQSDECHKFIVTVDKRIFIFRELDSITEMIDVDRQEQKVLPPLPNCRVGGGACSVSNEIYFFGGSDYESCMNKEIDVFNTWTYKWEFCTTFPEEFICVQNMGIIYWKGLIYIIGGENEHENVVGQCLTFNPITKKFDEISNLLTPRSHFGICGFRENIFVVGGFDHEKNILCTIERYSIQNGNWEKMNPLDVSRFGPTMVNVLDKLYIVGGGTNSIWSDAHPAMDGDYTYIEVFDPVKNVCRVMEELPPMDLLHPYAVVA